MKFNIDIMIAILNNRKKKLLAFFLLVVFLVFSYLFVRHEMGFFGSGYQYVSGRTDDLHIRKDGKIVIESAIADFDIINDYVVGLRLPAQRLECDDGGSYKIKLINRKEYFVLSMNTGRIFPFLSKEDFEDKLKELNILGASLDYSRFESTWEHHSKYYKNIDYSTCVIISRS